VGRHQERGCDNRRRLERRAEAEEKPGRGVGTPIAAVHDLKRDKRKEREHGGNHEISFQNLRVEPVAGHHREKGKRPETGSVAAEATAE
jgi:hypothetical protein